MSLPKIPTKTPLPISSIPTPSVSTKAAPVPSVPAKAAPVPTPSVPAKAAPVPTPSVPAKTAPIPTPSVPAKAAPVPTVPSVPAKTAPVPTPSVPAKATPVPTPSVPPVPTKTAPVPTPASPSKIPVPSVPVKAPIPTPIPAAVPTTAPSPSKVAPSPTTLPPTSPVASSPVKPVVTSSPTSPRVTVPSPKIPVTVSPVKPVMNVEAPAFVPKPVEISPVDGTKLVKDPRKYIDTYFGTRNGILGVPVEGVNYTLETLTYMTSHNRADQITDILVNKMNEIAKAEGKDTSFEIWECCAGIGGNTMSFLDNRNISHVTTFEVNDKRRGILKNNLAMYKLDDPSRLTIGPGAFPGVPKCDPGKRILHYNDPPWTLVKGHEANKEDYILSGMKVGDRTLEEIIASCSHCDLIAMRVPPGYKLAPVEGFVYEEILIKNSLLILAKPISKAVCQEDIDKYRAIVEERKAREREEEVVWEAKLKEYLRYTFLPRCISSDVALDKLVSPEAMEIWKVAFTHESFNPNIGQNYEEEELYGDSVLEMAYIKFIRQKYPQFNRSQLSELRTYYLAKVFQSGLAMKIGAGAYLRTRFRKSIHMYEDVIESSLGALDRIGDLVFRFGAGAGLCYNMVVSLYGDVEVDIERTTKNPKTQIKEVFERLGFINPKAGEKVPEEAIQNEDERTVTFIVRIPPLGMSILKGLGLDLKDNIIAEVTERTKKVASDNAYVKALQYMNSLGITSQFVEEFAKRRDLENPEIYPYVLGVQDRLKKEGFETFYFSEDRAGGKDSTGKYIQMIGVKPDGYKEVLVMTENPVESSIEGRQNLLLRYKNYSP